MKAIDGKRNSDLITDTSLSLSGPVPTGQYFKTGAQAKVAALIFADEGDESRLTLDSIVQIEAEKSLLPEPYQLRLRSVLNSNSTNVAVAEGTAARQAESHTATLDAGASFKEIAPRTDSSVNYQFARYDFLNGFLFNRKDGQEKEKGADYFRNGLSGSLDHHFNKLLDATLRSDLGYLAFTRQEKNLLQEKTPSFDRLDWQIAGGLKQLFSAQTKGRAEAGLDFSHFVETQEPRSKIVLGNNGMLTTVITQPRNNESSLFFDIGFDFSPDTQTTLHATAEQRAIVDVDGDRVLTRTVALHGSRKFAERWDALVGGGFTEFQSGDSLSGSTQRFSVSTALKYAVTQALALSAGWNYVNQNAKRNELNFLGASSDYEGNRVFIELSAGLIGTTR